MPLPYKSLVLCFDGTWNDLSSHTNVSRLYAEVADVSTGCPDQIKFYDEGVGTGKLDKIRGGAFGMGLDENIRNGYAWLASIFECESDPGAQRASAPSDQRQSNGDLANAKLPKSGKPFLAGSDIYIFGFSRGAFTARSLGGLINYLGIPRISAAVLDKDEAVREHPTIQQAWELYVDRPPPELRRRFEKGEATPGERRRVEEHDRKVEAFRGGKFGRYPVRIHFMGVWDTVGALGIPPVFGLVHNPVNLKYRFHDTTLGESIRNAFHAVAIDEHRLPYTATLWTEGKPTTEAVEQRWFPGAHADVGGGYVDDLLHSLPLKWLAGKAAACGLEFSNDRHIAIPDMKSKQPGATVIPASIAMVPAAFDLDGTEYLSPVHDSYAEFLGGVFKVVRAVGSLGTKGRVYRRILVPADGVAQSIDESAFQKWRMDGNYRPPNLAQAGRSDVSYDVAFLDPALSGGAA